MQDKNTPSSTMLNEWIFKALDLAKQAELLDEVPVGALIIEQDKLIGTGFNCRERDQDPTAHAEMIAIREAASHRKSWRLNGCILVVTLEPCPMCLAAAQQARIGEIIFGAKDLKGGALSLGYSFHNDTRTNHRFSVTYRENLECSEILSHFFKNKRNKHST
jgi:tRNA(adenine34) deaminase